MSGGVETSFIELGREPGAKLAYALHTRKEADPEIVLVVFINGLGLPMSAWAPAIDQITGADSTLALLMYDRYGQGQSQPDPAGLHAIQDAAQDLNHFLSMILRAHFESNPKLVFVAHSLGVPLIRVYSETFKPEVAAALFLDSNIANTDFVSIFPHPDSASFESAELPDDTTLEALTSTRVEAQAVFAPSAPNKEQLDRSNLPQSLPSASAPTLLGTPYLTVVGHDPEAFAVENVKHGFTTRGLTLKYMSPFWNDYNIAMKHLTAANHVRGVVIAKGASHFIQRDRPDLVAREVLELVKVINGADVQLWQTQKLCY